MRTEPATVLVVILGSIGFFFLVLPLMVVLANLAEVWRTDRVIGLILAGVVVLTGLFFALYLVGLGMIAFSRG
ncbi:MAG: hypothetical protein M0T85_04715 [Dehalococcoidales bacterium]|nr:hypothetical protein [Dehalococcoidales bacterium]